MLTKLDFDLHKIKLIMWDIDDTFWTGTLSEGNIEIIDANIQLLKLSTSRGIINSICSKNDFECVKNKLEEIHVWDYFVFPSVDWTPKGARLKQQILDMALRAENVLFIDDNLHNLEEVKFMNQGIMTATPEIIGILLESILDLGKDDNQHSRLKQYKVMEEKHKAKGSFLDNHDFLLSSGICVEIFNDCISEKERLLEMIQRTNQLNYTKKRIDLMELESILKDSEYECGYVKVKDNFGEYGISGFFALKNNVLEHFMFSCRVLGMGVEQYTYAILKFPEINVVGDVAVRLNLDGVPDWINKTVEPSNKDDNFSIVNDNSKVLIKGPCDMLSVFSYIKNHDNLIDTEFTFINEETGVSIESYNHTEHIVNSLRLTNKQKRMVINEVPFGDDRLYETAMFNDEYNVIFFSLLLDSALAVYKRKETGETVCFGHCKDDFTNPVNWERIISGEIYSSNCKFDRKMLEDFRKKYDYVGRITVEQVVDNIKYILSNLSVKTKVVMITGSEIQYMDERSDSLVDVHHYYKELNEKISIIQKQFPNCEVLSFTKYIDSQQCFYNSSNHFSKKVYFGLANDMVDIINKSVNTHLKQPSKIKLWIEQKIRGFVRIIPSKKLVRKLYYVFKIKNNR